MVQETLRKDIEPIFGVIQAGFHVLRKEAYLWRDRDVLAVSETCFILHNVLFRMNQEGYLEGDATEYSQTVNLVTELYEEECQQAL